MALVLTRSVGEKLIVGDQAEIVFQILEVRGNQVRVGITADKSIPVHRAEIYERIYGDGCRHDFECDNNEEGRSEEE